MKLAIVDLETTTADSATATIVEIACCVWDADCRAVTSVLSTVVSGTENPAEKVNGIPVAALAGAVSLDYAMQQVGVLVAQADAIVAHNGDGFDRPILHRHDCRWVATLPWIDTMDLEWPRFSSSRSLLALAAAHGVPIGTVHRAVDDVLLVARLFERAAELGADINAMLVRGLRPKAKFQALVSYDDREKAKAAGFRWSDGPKTWTRSMAIADTAALPFAVRQIEGNDEPPLTLGAG